MKNVMLRSGLLPAFSICLALLAADAQSWKDKPIAEWTDDEAKQVLTDSPWARAVEPTIDRSNDGQQRRRGMGRRGGMGGIGIGLPGGMGRRGGMGYPGGGYPGGRSSGGGYPGEGSGRSENNRPARNLRIRWESALPVRGAELKAHETTAPALDEEHYAIAVYGLPNRVLNNTDEKTLGGQFKKQASIKREGKKDLKPSSVQVLRRDDGPVVVYLFPRKNEITRQDKRIEFDAKMLRFQIKQSFYVEDMTYQGKLEL